MILYNTITLNYCRMNNLEKLYNLGLYISDLSMHNASRDMVLLGGAQSKQLATVLVQVNRHEIRKETKYFSIPKWHA